MNLLPEDSDESCASSSEDDAVHLRGRLGAHFTRMLGIPVALGRRLERLTRRYDSAQTRRELRIESDKLLAKMQDVWPDEFKHEKSIHENSIHENAKKANSDAIDADDSATDATALSTFPFLLL